MALPSGATQRSNLFVPEVFTEAIVQGFVGVKALLGTGVAIMNGTLPAKHRGGDRVTVPYFENIGEVQDVAEGTPLTVTQLTQQTDVPTVQRSGIAFDMTKWAEVAAAEDPYAAMAAMCNEAMLRRVDMAMLQCSAGDTAVGAASNTNLLPIGASGTPLVVNLGSGTKLSYSGIVQGKLQWHDEQDDVALMVVHSTTYGSLLQQVDGNGRPLVLPLTESVQGLKLQTYLGVPLMVSDRVEPIGGLYTSLIYKKKALAFWYNLKPAMTKLPDPLTDSELTALNMYWVAYMYRNMPGKRYPGCVAIQHGN